MSAVKILSSTKVTRDGGVLHRCQHLSTSTRCDMIFALFLPKTYSEALLSNQKLPVVYYLSGLTCTDQNFCQKAGPLAFLQAEKHGLALVAPDTSPRGENVADDAKYDLGQGAGFYINATCDPWKSHYQMETYIQEELPTLVQANWPGLSSSLRSVMGHSMGGHGAMTLAFKSRLHGGSSPWISVSALSPICHPTACPWGKKAFENYLGSVEAGIAHDALKLLRKIAESSKLYDDILIDQGTADEFLAEQLCLDDFEAVASTVGQKLSVRRHEGMDHSYYFIACCIADHIDFHAGKLALASSSE